MHQLESPILLFCVKSIMAEGGLQGKFHLSLETDFLLKHQTSTPKGIPRIFWAMFDNKQKFKNRLNIVVAEIQKHSKTKTWCGILNSL